MRKVCESILVGVVLLAVSAKTQEWNYDTIKKPTKVVHVHGTGQPILSAR